MVKAKTASSYISGDLFNDLKCMPMSEVMAVPAEESFKPSNKVTEYSHYSRKKVYEKIVNHEFLLAPPEKTKTTGSNVAKCWTHGVHLIVEKQDDLIFNTG